MKFRDVTYKRGNMVGTILVVLLMIYIPYRFYTKNNNYISYEDACLRDKQEQFNGVIEEALYDKMNKRAFTIKLVNSDKKLILADVYGHAKCPVDRGDSIVKREGVPYYLVYKRSLADSVVRLDFDCDRFGK